MEYVESIDYTKLIQPKDDRIFEVDYKNVTDHEFRFENTVSTDPKKVAAKQWHKNAKEFLQKAVRFCPNDLATFAKDGLIVNPMFSRFYHEKQLGAFIQCVRDNKEFVKTRTGYQDTWQRYFYSLLPTDESFINRDYDLFIHLVSYPDAPQIWRRIRVHGSTLMKELSELIIIAMGWYGSHSSEFRVQMRSLTNLFSEYFQDILWTLTRENIKDPLFEKYISIRDTKQESIDEQCWGWFVCVCFHVPFDTYFDILICLHTYNKSNFIIRFLC